MSITVANSWKYFDEADPVFTGTVGELVEEGDLGDVTYRRTNTDEAVGVYPGVLTADYEENSNYRVTVVNGAFEIKTASVAGAVLVAEGGSWTYDGNAHAAKAEVTGAEGYTVYYKTGDGDWTTEAPSVTDVADGMKAVSVKATRTGYEDLTANDVSIQIIPRDASIIVDDAWKYFDAKDPVFTGTPVKLVKADDLGTVTYRRTNSEEAVGIYNNVITADYVENSNYNVSIVPGDFEIKTASIAGASLKAEGGSWTYDGKAHAVEAVVQGAENYTIYYKVGDADWTTEAPTVTDVAEGTKTVSVKATRTGYADLTAEDVTIKITAKPATITVKDGWKYFDEADPAFTGTIDGLVTSGDLGKVTYVRTNDEEAVGTYADVLTAEYVENSNYQVTVVNGDFEIKTASIAGASLKAEGGSWIYDGEAHEASAAVSGAKGYTIYYKTGDGDWTTEAPSVTNVADGVKTVSVKATRTGYADLTAEDVSIWIKAKSVNITVDSSWKYFDDEDPAFTGKIGKLVAEGDLGTVSYRRTNTDEAVGTYEDVLTADYTENSNYIVTVKPGDFEIKTASVEGANLTAAGGSWTYDGMAHAAGAEVKGAEGYTIYYKTGESDWTTEVPSVTDVAEGKKTVSVKAVKTGYEDLTAEDVTIEITAKPVQITVDDSWKYFDAADPVFTGNVGELILAGDLGEVSYRRTNTEEAVGVYKDVLTADYKANSNYQVEVVTGDFEIKTAYIPGASLKAEGGSWVYDGTAHAADAKVTGAEGYTVYYKVGDGEWTTEAPSVTNVSDGVKLVEVKATRTGYEDLTASPVTIEITTKPVTITVDSKWKYFDAADPEFTGNVGELVTAGDLGEVTYRRTNTDEAVGTYTDVLTADYTENSNYAVTVKPGDFEIRTASIPGAVLTAEGGSWVYDGKSHEAKAQVTGAEGYTVYYKVGDADWTTEAPSVTNVADGVKTVSVKAVRTGYEDLTAEDVAIQITVKPVTITVDNSWKYFDAKDPVFTGNVGDLAAPNDLGTVSFRRTNTNEAVGVYEDVLTAVYSENSNYQVTVVPGDFEIKTASIEGAYLDARGGSWVYDGKSHPAEAVVQGAEGYTVYYKTGDGDWTTTAPSVTEVGEGQKTVSIKAVKTGYEELTAEDVTIQITAKPVTITVDNSWKYFDAADPVFDGTVDGLVADEDLGDVVYSRTNTEESVGIYPGVLTAGYEENENYTVTVIPGSFEIKTASIPGAVLTAEGGSWVYDGKAHAATAEVSGAEGYTIYYKTADGDWTTTAPSVTDVSEGTVTVSVKAEREGYVDLAADNVSIKVTPRPITITAASAEKSYDGTALVRAVSTVGLGQLLPIHSVTATVEGSQTFVGSSKNVVKDVKISTLLGGDDVTGNYKITPVDGTLTITDKDVDVDKVVTKTHDNDKTYRYGDTITFDISVKNIYDEAKTITIIEQDGVTITGNDVFEDVAPGEVVTTTATYTVTEEDILNGSFTNTVTAKFSDENKDYEKDDTVDKFEDPAGHLTVTKETTSKPANGKTYALGETIIYKVVAVNDGNLTLNSVVVTDELTGDEWTVGTLQPGQSSEAFKAEYTVTEEDILKGTVLNEATAAGKSTDPENPNPEIVPGNTEDPTDHPNGHLTVTKETTSTPANGEAYALGETITYKITAANDGNLTLKNVVVTDELTGDEWTIDSLAPGQSSEAFTASHKVTQKDILNGSVVNEATAAGKSPDPDKPDPGVEPGETEDPTVDPNGHLTVTKETTSTPENGAAYALGETITYKVTATNDGNLTLKNVVVTDELTGDKWTIESLKPGESSEAFTAEYKVTEQDILKGSVLNVATAKGESPDPDKPDPGVDPGEKEDPTETQQPSLFIEKIAAPAPNGGYALGDTIPYTIKVVNNGNVTISDITVTDDLTGNQWTIGSLEPNAEKSYSTEYVVTEKDIMAGKVVNVAAAEGTAPDESKVGKEDTETTVTENSNPHLSVSKETTSKPANGEAYALGETITYKITAVNDGNLTLKNIVITDELTGDEWTIDTLVPGQSSEAFTARHKVTEKDILKGSVLNEAAASAESPDPENPDPGIVPGETEDPTVDPAGHLTVSKETTSTPANGAAYDLGETITYKIIAANDGNLTLNHVVVTDELTGDEWTVGTLAPGQSSEVFTASYKVTEQDILNGRVLNVATAAGESPDPENPEPGVDPGEKEDPTASQQPSLFVEKTAAVKESGAYGLGDTIPYMIKVVNNGNVTVTDITVTDDLTGNEWTIDQLEPGAYEEYQAEYTVTEADVMAGKVVNVATAEGTDPEGEKVSKEDTETVETEISNPHLTVVKETTSAPANGESYVLGETISYKVVVTNDGNLTLKNVVVTDELTGDEWTIDSLKPGESSEAFNASHKVTQKDILKGSVVNEATAAGESPDPDKPDPGVDPGETEDPTDNPNGHLTVTKETTSTPENGAAYALGETITYKIVAANDGNLTLENVVVTDDLTGDEWTIDSLKPGESSEVFTAEYKVTEQDILNGTVLNVATAKGDSPDPEKPDPGVDPGEKEDPTVTPQPSLFVEKTAAAGPEGGFSLGDTVPYTIKVVNNGNVTISGITVNDDLTGGQWTIDSLEPNGTQEFTTDYVVTEADILAGQVVNVAAAGGTAPDGSEVTGEGTETIVTESSTPHLSISKETTSTPANGETYALGETITYSIVATNDGNLTLTNVVVRDELTGDEWTIDSLAPGASSETFTAEHTVTSADILNGSVLNVATAGGETPDPDKPDPGVDPGEKEDPTVDPNPSVAVVKEVTSTPADGEAYALGETISYRITVTNDGNIPVENIRVEDSLVSITENIITSLAPGESREFTYEYTVTEADIRNGQVVNTAAASTDDPEGPKGSDEVVTPTEPADAAYTVNKSVVEPQDEYRVGDTIQYQIAVSNTGNVTLHNVVVSDNLQGASGSVTFTNAGDYTVEGNKAIINEIGIGETIVLNCEYLIVREDAGASISNIASVRTDETGETPREDETEETPVVNIYRLTIHYVDAAGTAVAPDYTGEYEVGAAFSIESPAVTGYTPNYATVNSGADGMPAADVEVTVTYTANPVIVPIVPPVTPTTPATPAAPVTPVTPAAVTPTTPTAIIPPTPTPAAPIDAELTENDEGDYDLTPIQDEETPLAKQNLDDHVCCILHFLLMLLALIVLAFYTRSMKKRQARIFELREELELEMARRGLGEEEKEDDAE